MHACRLAGAHRRQATGAISPGSLALRAAEAPFGRPRFARPGTHSLVTAGRPFSGSAATGAAMTVGKGTRSWSGLVFVMVSVTFWAHRFATGLPCRASSLAGGAMLASLRVAAGMGCGSRPSGRASLARSWPQDPATHSPGRLGGNAAGSAQSQTRRGRRPPIALSPLRHQESGKCRTRTSRRNAIGNRRPRGLVIHPTGQLAVQPSLSSGHPPVRKTLSGIHHCGKSAPARVKARRRPGCWQPDSHGRSRSLRIGAAARPAPLAASRP